MRFGLDEEQAAIQAGARAVLAKACPPAVVRAAWQGGTGRSPELWKTISEAGLLGVAAPTDLGGLGMDTATLCAVLEECGRVALPEPVLETAAIAVPLLCETAPDVAARVVPDVLAGRTRLGVMLGDQLRTPDLHVADVVLLTDGLDLHLVPRAEVQLTPQPSVDGARRLSSIAWTPRAGTRIAGGTDIQPRVEAASLRARLGAAAELLGLAAQMLAMTVEHVKLRTQFGQPIGAFQAVKHHLADALVKLELARPMVLRAAWSLDRGARHVETHVAAAKLFASEAALLVARKALQCHGAIGYSFEYDLHLFMKRAWALASEHGAPDWHRAIAAEAILDGTLIETLFETGDL